MDGGGLNPANGGYNNRFATCIGFESLTEKDVHCPLTDPDQSEPKNGRVFPPFMSSLSKNGRPRFNLVKIRDNGRLGIAAALKLRPEVLVVREEGGHVRIRSLDTSRFYFGIS